MFDCLFFTMVYVIILDTENLDGTLSFMNQTSTDILSRLVVRPVEDSGEINRWNETMVLWHPLKSSAMMGEQIRYVAEVGGEWLALLGWSQASLKLAAREAWIGWDGIQQRQRLHLVVQNARFLVLPTTPKIANLASRCLGLNVQRLSDDWQKKFHHRVLLAETFVEPPRFPGTCYKAAGWTEIGVTSGYRRERRTYVHHGVSRTIFARELIPGARKQLCSATLEDDKPLTRIEPAIQPIAHDKGIFAIIREHITDPRGRQGRDFRIEALIALLLVGMLAGQTTCDQIATWIKQRPEHEKRRLWLPVIRDGGGRWHCRVPCANTLRNLLRILPIEQLERAAAAYVVSCGVNAQHTHLAIDGKTLCGSATADQPAQVQVSLYRPDTGMVIDQIAVPKGTSEVTAVRTLVDRNNVTGSIISGDAAHANHETAALIRKKGHIISLRLKRASLAFWTPSNRRSRRMPPPPPCALPNASTVATTTVDTPRSNSIPKTLPSTHFPASIVLSNVNDRSSNIARGTPSRR